jgi:hypothetical protein
MRCVDRFESLASEHSRIDDVVDHDMVAFHCRSALAKSLLIGRGETRRLPAHLDLTKF